MAVEGLLKLPLLPVAALCGCELFGLLLLALAPLYRLDDRSGLFVDSVQALELTLQAPISARYGASVPPAALLLSAALLAAASSAATFSLVVCVIIAASFLSLGNG